MGGSTVRRFGGLSLLAAATLTAQPLNRLTAQQVAPNRAATYLFPTDVRDARAIWVNPAGLGLAREASVYAEVGVSDPGSRGRHHAPPGTRRGGAGTRGRCRHRAL